MKITYAILAGAALLVLPTAAEAARCPKGQIYRVSQGVCQAKSAAIRAGVYRPRSKAAVKHRTSPAPVVARDDHKPVYPPPTPPWLQRTPMVEGVEPGMIAIGPFGALLPMQESTQSRLVRWAAQNGEQQ